MGLKQLLLIGLILVPSCVWALSGPRGSSAVEDSEEFREKEKISFERQFQQIREESAVLLNNIDILNEEAREPVRKLLGEIRNLVGPFSTRGQVLKGQGQSWEEQRSHWQETFVKASRKLQMAKSHYGKNLEEQ